MSLTTKSNYFLEQHRPADLPNEDEHKEPQFLSITHIIFWLWWVKCASTIPDRNLVVLRPQSWQFCTYSASSKYSKQSFLHNLKQKRNKHNAYNYCSTVFITLRMPPPPPLSLLEIAPFPHLAAVKSR